MKLVPQAQKLSIPSRQATSISLVADEESTPGRITVILVKEYLGFVIPQPSETK